MYKLLSFCVIESSKDLRTQGSDPVVPALSLV